MTDAISKLTIVLLHEWQLQHQKELLEKDAQIEFNQSILIDIWKIAKDPSYLVNNWIKFDRILDVLNSRLTFAHKLSIYNENQILFAQHVDNLRQKGMIPEYSHRPTLELGELVRLSKPSQQVISETACMSAKCSGTNSVQI